MNSVERVKNLCKERGIPVSRLEKELGFANGYISQLRKGVFPSNRLVEIAEYFGVSVDYLVSGTEATKKAPVLTNKDKRDIARDLEQIMSALDNAGDLQFDGDPMSDEARESIRAAMKLGLEAAKAKNKERFTPRKYRKG